MVVSSDPLRAISDAYSKDGIPPVLAWDGSRPSPLYAMDAGEYMAGLPDFRGLRYIVIKQGSETLVHSGKPRRMVYSFFRSIGQAVHAKESGAGVCVTYSGPCSVGRTVRNSKHERIFGSELEERRKDAEAGRNIIKGLIKEISWKMYGENPVFVDVTPEDYLDPAKKESIVRFCLTNMGSGRTVWLNEDDSIRQQPTYENTFNENDWLASLTAQELNKYGHAGLVILMDRRGFLAGRYLLSKRDGERLYHGPEDLYVIRLVKNPEGMKSQVIDLKIRQGRVTRGGPLTKIGALGTAAKNGVHSWAGSGMFCMTDSSHMRYAIPEEDKDEYRGQLVTIALPDGLPSPRKSIDMRRMPELPAGVADLPQNLPPEELLLELPPDALALLPETYGGVEFPRYSPVSALLKREPFGTYFVPAESQLKVY